MTEPRYLSTAQVSAALGIGVSTIKRWVDGGLLPAHRTAGGHRKILLTDVLRLVREMNLAPIDTGRLGLREGENTPQDTTQLARHLHTLLQTGDEAGVRSLFLEAYQSGMAIEDLGDQVIGPVMSRVGHQWETGAIDVYQEHRGTLLCVSGLHALKQRVENHAATRRPLAVGGNPEKDPYVLASLLIQIMLMDYGWEVINLGPLTPVASFRQAVKDLRPRLLWLSVNYLEDPELFLQEYRQLYQDATATGSVVAVGGQALHETVRARMPYTTFGDGLRQLGSFAQSLHPRPQRPQRGRPRTS